MLGLNAFALVAFGAVAVLAHWVSRGAGAQRAVRAVSAVLLGVNVLRYALIGPLLGELRVPVEYSAFAYFAVPLILLTGWKGARSWAAYSGLMAGFFYYITMIAAGGALYGETPHWEIYLSLFCHGALFFCGFVTVSTLPCTGGYGSSSAARLMSRSAPRCCVPSPGTRAGCSSISCWTPFPSAMCCRRRSGASLSRCFISSPRRSWS